MRVILEVTENDRMQHTISVDKNISHIRELPMGVMGTVVYRGKEITVRQRENDPDVWVGRIESNRL